MQRWANGQDTQGLRALDWLCSELQVPALTMKQPTTRIIPEL